MPSRCSSSRASTAPPTRAERRSTASRCGWPCVLASEGDDVARVDRSDPSALAESTAAGEVADARPRPGRADRAWRGRPCVAPGARPRHHRRLGAAASRPSRCIDIDLDRGGLGGRGGATCPTMEAGGWVLRIRERACEEHRLLRLEEPECDLHVWSPGRRRAAATPGLPRLAHQPPRRPASGTSAAKRSAAAEGCTDGMHHDTRRPGRSTTSTSGSSRGPGAQHDPRPR